MTVKEYLEDIPPERAEKMNSLIDLIKELYPDAAESMKYKMPTYESPEGWVAVANQKNYVSLYTCSPEHLVEFKKKHPKIKTGKGCINFTNSVDIPLDDLESVIKSAMSRGH